MYRVVWGYTPMNSEIVGTFNTFEDAEKAVGIKSKELGGVYLRSWEDGHGTWTYDYGSWSKFIYVYPVNEVSKVA